MKRVRPGRHYLYMKPQTYALLWIALLLLAPGRLHADQEADALNEKYKLALANNQIEEAVTFLCDAAKLDPKKYEKKCIAAQHHANEQLQAFDGFFNAGQTAMQQRDYTAAIKQFSKITFGLRHDDAQHLMEEARKAEDRPRLLASERTTLAAAQAAYDRGDLTAAESSAKLITIGELQPFSQQILTSVRVYQQAIQAGEAAMKAGRYKEAQEKFKFAQSVRSNGPGDPAGKLQQLDVLIAAVTVTPTHPSGGKPPVVAAGSDTKLGPITGLPLKPTDDAGKIKAALAEGRAAEGRKDVDGALQAYERVLAINPRQSEAIEGKKRTLANVSRGPQGIETTLAMGLHSFYKSQLAEAGDALALYLTGGGSRNKGAAYFYLGATFASQALLANPAVAADNQALQQHALLEFKQARCERYKPVERYISPKVLALWNKSTC